MTARRFLGMRLRPLVSPFPALSTLLFIVLAASPALAPPLALGAQRTGAARICARTTEYGCYTNHKYGYVLAWPKRFVAPLGESDAGDGQAFRSPNGDVDLKCWGAFNTVLETSLPEAFAQALAEPGREVVYTHRGADFFVVSGYVDGNIFYHKTVLKHEVLATFEIVYAPALKTALGPVVKDLAASFRIDPDYLWR